MRFLILSLTTSERLTVNMSLRSLLPPIALRDQTMMVRLMSLKEIKIDEVELVEKFGESV